MGARLTNRERGEFIHISVVAQKTEGPQAYARYMADLLTFLL